MNTFVFATSLSALLSVTSLLAVLLRVSPLTAPVQALGAFYVSMFLSLVTVGSLGFYSMWQVVPYHAWDKGQIVGISLRQGFILGLLGVCVLTFHILNLLSWWVALLIIAVFVLIEVALEN